MDKVPTFDFDVDCEDVELLPWMVRKLLAPFWFLRLRSPWMVICPPFVLGLFLLFTKALGIMIPPPPEDVVMELPLP